MTALDRAMQRLIGEVNEGLRHGFFEVSLTCEVIGQDRRRLTLRAGKSYQFVIPKEDCLPSATGSPDSYDGSDTDVA